MLNQFAVEIPTLTSQPMLLPKHPIPEGMARGMGSPRHVPKRRRRTREGPEPAWCANT